VGLQRDRLQPGASEFGRETSRDLNGFCAFGARRVVPLSLEGLFAGSFKPALVFSEFWFFDTFSTAWQSAGSTFNQCPLFWRCFIALSAVYTYINIFTL
jgi:hypothetical protein